MNALATVLILCCLSCVLSPVYSCSCPFPLRSRSDTIFNGFCSSRTYVGTVIGATCNCNPAQAGEERTSTYCQDYQLQDTTNVVSAEVVARGECSNARPPFPLDNFPNCTALGTSVGVVPSGLTVVGPPSDSINLLPVTNTTRPFDSCGLSCPFNIDDEGSGEDYDYFEYERQPCFYRVRVEEVFRGNITEGDILMEGGPDVLTSCGSIGLLLQINQGYVVGIGGSCSQISEWSTSDMYTMQEFEQLRRLRERYEAGSIECGAIQLVPSVFILLLLFLSTMAAYTDI